MEGEEGAHGLPEIVVTAKDYVAEIRALSMPFSKLPSLRNITRYATFIVQKAVVEIILMPIYESEFLGFSYGFRPGRGAHDALDALAVGITEHKVNLKIAQLSLLMGG